MISVLETTLRDGEQGEGISFTVKDRLKITHLLDQLGVHYIEGGWPGANPKAVDYFNAVGATPLTNAKLAAFGSTRRAKNDAKNDVNLNAILQANTPVAVIFGKSWDFHVTHALNISLDQNLEMVTDSIRFLKSHHKEVIFDAEHFFDGYKANREYALQVLKAAESGGADILCLCDTNGGTMLDEVDEIVGNVVSRFSKPIGIHAHNDSGLGVAVSLRAIDVGATHVQGTLNGYGERCGNANLATIIANLMLKKNRVVLPTGHLELLTPISRRIDEIANITHHDHLPFVGRSAFAHKAGVHVSAIAKSATSYEHIPPETVGNHQRILISELSGQSNVMSKATDFGIGFDPKSPQVGALLESVKALENQGYQFEDAEASFELLMRKFLTNYQPPFTVDHYRVMSADHGDGNQILEAIVKLTIGDTTVHVVGEGNGPVSALDHALRRALSGHFPVVENVKLVDYRVRVLNSRDGTNAQVRVFIESAYQDWQWGTVGVSHNVIAASWEALVDSFRMAILKGEMGSNGV